MLNISAKEFVPSFPTRCCATATVTATSNSSSLSSSGPEAPATKSDAHTNPPTCNGTTITTAAATEGTTCSSSGCGDSGKQPHQQLSPKALAFVPRAATPPFVSSIPAATSAAALLPSSRALTQRSDSNVSSSVVSRVGPAGGAEDGDDEQPTSAAPMFADTVDGDYSWYGTGYDTGYGVYGCDGVAGVDGGAWEVEAVAAEGGEAPSPEASAVTYGVVYGYEAYNNYCMPYAEEAAEDVQEAVYYTAEYGVSYDAYQQSYYWGGSTGGPYDDYSDEGYTAWVPQQQPGGGDVGASTAPLGAPAPTPSTGDGNVPLPANATSTSTSTSRPHKAAPAGPDSHQSDPVDGGDLLDGLTADVSAALAPSDAAELLGLFFPHYPAPTLARILEHTGGDLRAAFGELVALEKEVAAERQGAGRGRQRSGGAGGGGKPRGGGNVTFKLGDLTAFPSLSPSSSPHMATKSKQAASGGASSAEAAETATPDAAAASPPASAADPATITTSDRANASTEAANVAASQPASSTFPGSAPPPAAGGKPNFAALLRSHGGAPASPSPAAAAAASTSAATAGTEKVSAGTGPRQPQPHTGVSSIGSGNGSGTATGAHTVPRRKGRGGANGGSSSAGAASAVPWVSTGEAVAAQYSDERREAALLARARNQYFQQATLAFLSGNKALARELGRKGREANEAMKAAHAAAAARIFAQRNAGRGAPGAHPSKGAAAAPSANSTTSSAPPPQQQRQPQRPADSLFVDLHGLHAAEAVTVLEGQIEEARAAGYRFLRVCTGTGHHTKGSKTPARLPASVADTLLANHITFRTLQPGLLEAKL